MRFHLFAYMTVALLLPPFLACSRRSTTSTPSPQSSAFVSRMTSSGLERLVGPAAPKDSIVDWGAGGGGGTSGASNDPNVSKADYTLHAELRFWTTDKKIQQDPTPQRRDEFMRNLRSKIMSLLSETGGQASNVKESLDDGTLAGFSFAYTEGAANGIFIAKLTSEKHPQGGPDGGPIDVFILDLLLKESSTNVSGQ